MISINTDISYLASHQISLSLFLLHLVSLSYFTNLDIREDYISTYLMKLWKGNEHVAMIHFYHILGFISRQKHHRICFSFLVAFTYMYIYISIASWWAVRDWKILRENEGGESLNPCIKGRSALMHCQVRPSNARNDRVVHLYTLWSYRLKLVNQ